MVVSQFLIMALEKTETCLFRRCTLMFAKVVVIYLTPFFLVFFDEVIFKTYWFASHFPLWIQKGFWFVYPFYEFAFQMLDPKT